MRKQAGFSIVEVLIAIVLLVIGIGALARSGADVMRGQNYLATRTVALQVARGHLERIRGGDPTNLVSETPVQVNSEGLLDPNGAYTRSVMVTDLAPNLVQVTVTVDFPRASQPIELVTLAFTGG